MSSRSLLRRTPLAWSALGVAVASAALNLSSGGSASAATAGQSAVSYAAQEAGKPYVYGSAGPNSFDCSGLVQYVYHRLGVSLPRTAAEQYGAMRHIPQSAAAPGDVLFFHDGSGAISHDAIYAGGNQMWAAPRPGEVVQEQAIYSSEFYVGSLASPAPPAHVARSVPAPPLARGAAVGAATLLRPGNYLESTNHRHVAVQQGDGNFVLYGDGSPVWSSAAATGDRLPGAALAVQNDGNVVLYGPSGAQWTTRTAGTGPAHRLVLQDDGNLVLYGSSGPLWATGTAGR